MCGIAGIYLATSREVTPTRRHLLEAMTNKIAHRGPDGSGHWHDGNVGLGHRRLAIIDIATGQQPLFNEDGSVVVVFNGEIYNFVELASELKSLGHQFKTHSDTEVIVHAWEQWGTECVKKFRGMFVFALWDQNKKSLFLARDRLGVKPLYYAKTIANEIIFASELKALLIHPRFNRTLRNDAIADYFSFGYIPDPKSVFTDCFKLAPAHWMLWTESQLEPKIQRYWDVEFKKSTLSSEADLADELRARVTEAVKIRMISEVPLGAFLSGGVDSSAVVATMANLNQGRVTTCSIGFDQAQFDESSYATEVAKQYETNHYSRVVSASDFDVIEKLAGIYDEPFADSSALPTLRVSQLAREKVTVALSGDGGDETFGGYGRYKSHLATESIRNSIPSSIRKPLFGTLAAIYPKADWAPKFLRARSTFAELADDSVDAYMRTVSFIRPPEIAKLFSLDFRKDLHQYDAFDQVRAVARSGPQDPLAMIQNLDYKFYLPGDINVKVDRASMAASLESREPLMDHPLIEWAASLPSHLKIRGGETKYLFKKAFEGQLSNDVLYRRKMGFSVPLANWFKGDVGNELESSIKNNSDFGSGFIDAAATLQFLSEHRKGSDWATPLWTVYMFNEFLKNINTVKPRYDLS